MNHGEGSGTSGTQNTVSGVNNGKWARMISDNEPIAKSEPRASVNSPKMARRTVVKLLEGMRDETQREAALGIVRSEILYMNPADVAEIVECAAKYDIKSALEGIRLMLDSPAKDELRNALTQLMFAANGHMKEFRSGGNYGSEHYAAFTEGTLLTIDEAEKFTGNKELKKSIIDAVCGYVEKSEGSPNGLKICKAVLSIYLKHFDFDVAVKTGLAGSHLKQAIETIHRLDGGDGTSLLWRDAKKEIDAYFNGNKKKTPIAVDQEHVLCLALLPGKHQEEGNWEIVLAAVDAKLKNKSSPIAIIEAVPPSRRAPYAMLALESPHIDIGAALKILASVPAEQQTDELWGIALKEFKSVAWSADAGSVNDAIRALAEIPEERYLPFRMAFEKKQGRQAQSLHAGESKKPSRLRAICTSVSQWFS